MDGDTILLKNSDKLKRSNQDTDKLSQMSLSSITSSEYIMVTKGSQHLQSVNTRQTMTIFYSPKYRIVR